MFEKWKSRYENGWATIFQLQRLVELGVLKEHEVEEIIK